MQSAALQAALFSALTGDATLVALLSDQWGATAIFSDVPQADESEADDMFPYITFGAETVTEMDDKTQAGGNALVQINAWTRTADYDEAKQIADRIHAVLHKGSLTISGANHIATRMESIAFDLDPDGSTRRALMLFRITYFNT